MEYEQLKLSNQVCFPVYAASRLITRGYQPYLDKLGITYPQYLVLLVLWEIDGISVNEIAHKLILNTNTITPLLKRMEVQGIILRERSAEDERKVMVHLTDKGWSMREGAAAIPLKLAEGLQAGNMNLQELIELRDKLNSLIRLMLEKGNKDESET
jgi:MarR family transcriptional regulator, organic hydroperoxide resistance regulator